MFLDNSRYAKQKTAPAQTSDQRTVLIVKIRRLLARLGQPYIVQIQDRLDLLANQQYHQPTQFWRIADANTELKAGDLIENQREIDLPE